MSYDTHCSSCGMPYSDFAREGAKSCECHKMAAQAVRDFVFDKPALSAAVVAQEPVATKATQQASADFLHEEMIKLGSPLTYTACLTLTKRITDTNTLAWAGEVNKLCTEIGSLKNEIAALKSAANPPATSAGVGADEIARCLVEHDPNYSIYHMPGGPVRKWKAMSGAVYDTNELSDEAADRVIQRANAILALLSRGSGDQK